MMTVLVAASGMFASTPQAHPYPRAQAMVELLIAHNPDMLDALMHVVPPGTRDNVVIAAHLPKSIGEASDADDLAVMATGKCKVEVQKDGRRIGVLMPLKDAAGRPIGALGLMYRYRAAQDLNALLRRSELIRFYLSKRIASRDALFARR